MDNSLNLPKYIALPGFSSEEALDVRRNSLDIYRVSPEKPLGNTPLHAIRFSGFKPEQLVADLKRRGLEAFIAEPHDTSTGAVYAYHKHALQTLLNQPENMRILRESGWPVDADAFVKRCNIEMASNPSLRHVIAMAFNDRSVSKQDAATQAKRITGFVDKAAAGGVTHTKMDLSETEARALASRMTMKDFIACHVTYNTGFREILTSQNGAGLFAVLPRSSRSATDDLFNLYPNLQYTRDYEPKAAAELLLDANNKIRQQAPAEYRIDRIKETLQAGVDKIRIKTGFLPEHTKAVASNAMHGFGAGASAVAAVDGAKDAVNRFSEGDVGGGLIATGQAGVNAGTAALNTTAMVSPATAQNIAEKGIAGIKATPKVLGTVGGVLVAGSAAWDASKAETTEDAVGTFTEKTASVAVTAGCVGAFTTVGSMAGPIGTAVGFGIGMYKCPEWIGEVGAEAGRQYGEAAVDVVRDTYAKITGTQEVTPTDHKHSRSVAMVKAASPEIGGR